MKVKLKTLNKEEEEAYQQILNDERWINATTFRNQCTIIKTYLRNGRVNVSFERLGEMFGGKHCVEKQIKKIEREERNEIMDIGRPPLLSDTQRFKLIDLINDLHQRKYYPTYDEVRILIEDEFNILLTDDQVRNYLRNNTDFHFAIGDPMEQNRVDSSEAEIDEYYSNLNDETKNVDGRFIYNLDEVGEEEFGDSQEMTVIVPASYKKTHISVGCTRRKRCTGLVCISANGENPKPLIITPRKTIDSEIFSYVPKSSFCCDYQINGFMTKGIFKKWIMEVFIPFLQNQKRRYNYSGKTILLLDGLKAHASVLEELQQCLNENNITPIFLIPHTSDQCQPLDLGVFSNQKRITQSYRIPWQLSNQSKQILKVLYGIFNSTNPIQCCSAFRQAGIVYVENFDEPIPRIEIRRGCARAVRHYQSDFIENVEPITTYQTEAIKTRFDSEYIHNESKRFKLPFW